MEEVKNVATKEKIIEVAGLDEKIGRIVKSPSVIKEIIGESVITNDIKLGFSVFDLPLVYNRKKCFVLDWDDILALAELAGLFDDEEETRE